MTIQNCYGDLPLMEDNIEFVFTIWSHDDFEFEDKHDVRIDF